MKTMSVGNVSFKAVMLCKGPEHELWGIENGLCVASLGRSPDQQTFPYDSSLYKVDCNPVTNDVTLTDLFVTGEDVAKHKALKQASTDFVQSLGDEIDLTNFAQCKAKYEEFYHQNIARFLKVPEKVYTAKEVLDAINAKAFDFAKLAIREVR